MKSTFVNSISQCTLPVLLLVLIGVYSCDTYQDDPDLTGANPGLNNNQFFVYNNGSSSSLINLGSRISTSQKVSISIDNLPVKGELEEFVAGFYQYTPTVASGKDFFTVSFFSTQNNALLGTDSVFIMIEEDTSQLPCGLFAVNDFISGNAIGDITIDVLANDYVCQGDVVVSIHMLPDAVSPPYYGTASVQNNKIVYHPGSTFSGNDKIMYKISSISDPNMVSYAMAYIITSTQTGCVLGVEDDYFDIPFSSDSTLFHLPVFGNDSICSGPQPGSQYVLSVTSQPFHGNVTISPAGALFKVSQGYEGLIFTDAFTYQVCEGSACQSASVTVNRY